MKNPSLPTYPTMRAAAGATGFTLTTLRGFKNAGCNAFSQGGRVSLEKLVRWLADKHAGPDVGVDWPARLKKAQAEREEIRLAKDRRTVIPHAEVAAGINSGVAILFSDLDRVFASELPPALVGLDALAIRAKVLSEIERLKTLLREHFAAMENPAVTPEAGE